jgi:hypothetical protein
MGQAQDRGGVPIVEASRLPGKRQVQWRPAFSRLPRELWIASTVRGRRLHPQSRLDDMNEQGVDVQILYPTFTGQMLGREFYDTKLLAACCRALQ